MVSWPNGCQKVLPLDAITLQVQIQHRNSGCSVCYKTGDHFHMWCYQKRAHSTPSLLPVVRLLAVGNQSQQPTGTTNVPKNAENSPKLESVKVCKRRFVTKPRCKGWKYGQEMRQRSHAKLLICSRGRRKVSRVQTYQGTNNNHNHHKSQKCQNLGGGEKHKKISLILQADFLLEIVIVSGQPKSGEADPRASSERLEH